MRQFTIQKSIMRLVIERAGTYGKTIDNGCVKTSSGLMPRLADTAFRPAVRPFRVRASLCRQPLPPAGSPGGLAIRSPAEISVLILIEPSDIIDFS